MKADLPLLDLSSKAGLDSVLGIGIGLIILALIMMSLTLCLLWRMQRGRRRNRCAVHVMCLLPARLAAGRRLQKSAAQNAEDSLDLNLD